MVVKHGSEWVATSHSGKVCAVREDELPKDAPRISVIGLHTVEVEDMLATRRKPDRPAPWPAPVAM